MTSFEKVRQAGFHADLLEKTIRDLCGGSLPEHSLYNLETSFDEESVFRHLDYVGLHSRKMVAIHVDELASGLRQVATVFPLDQMGTVEVAQVLVANENAKSRSDGEANELFVNIAFGSTMTLDLDRVYCDDPDCELDHGYSGFLKREGLTMRFEDAPEEGSASSSADAMTFVRQITAAM